jgi:hypothetical protein
MQVYKFIELNSFGSITYVLPNDLGYAKLIASCSVKCDETFFNIVKPRYLNKKRWTILFIYYGVIMHGWFTNLNSDACMLYFYELFSYLMY